MIRSCSPSRLWAFTHGIIQLVMAKSADLARRGIAIPDFSNYAFKLLNDAMQQIGRPNFFCLEFDECLRDEQMTRGERGAGIK